MISFHHIQRSRDKLIILTDYQTKTDKKLVEGGVVISHYRLFNIRYVLRYLGSISKLDCDFMYFRPIYNLQ